VPEPAEPEEAAASFQGGGTLRDASIYVPRRADAELLERLLAHEFCHVLAPRQIGKSSLRRRTELRLRERGVQCVQIELSGIGSSGIAEDTWYYALAWEVAKRAGTPIDLAQFWREHRELAPVHRWSRFLRDGLLARSVGPIVLFIDEIDVVLTLPFSADDFFTSIREIYNARADEPACERISFCLLGVAAPGNLMRDFARTPFNVGHAVTLGDFTPEEARALLPGLRGVGGDAEALLTAVLGWTDGHPYMTQLVCEHLVRAEADRSGSPEEWVARVVEEIFLNRGRGHDSNLNYAERYVLDGEVSVPVTKMLDLYCRICEGKRVPAEPNSPVELHLCLSGMVAVRADADGRCLRVRNRIFATVFDIAWVHEHETDRLFGDLVLRWSTASSEARHELVLKGAALDEALVRTENRSLSELQQAFVRASLDEALRAKDAQARAEHQRRELAEDRTRVVRRYLRILLALVVALGAALAVAIWQFISATAAQRDAVLAAEQGARAAVRFNDGTHTIDVLLVAVQAVTGAGRNPSTAPTPVVEGLASALMPERWTLPLFGHEAAVVTATFSPDGSRVLTASDDATARLWDGYDGTPIAVLSGHTGALRTAAFSPRGTYIVTAGEDGAANLWYALDGTLMDTLRGHTDTINAAVFSPDETRLATASNDKTARLWQTPGDIELAALPHGKVVNAVAFSPDSARLATCGEDRAAQLWSARDGKWLASMIGHTASVSTVTFAPQGWVVTSSNDFTARLWDWNGKLIRSLTGHRGPILSAAISPDGSQTATAGRDSTAGLWDSSTGRGLFSLQQHQGLVSSIAYAPDGTRVVTTGVDRTARLWHTRDGKLLVALKGHGGEVNTGMFSPDGERIVTASNDHTARLWGTGALGRIPLVVLKGHNSSVAAAAFSPDGKLIVTASDDRNAGLWDARSGTWIATLAGHEAAVSRASFSADGRRILTLSVAGPAVLWEPAPCLLKCSPIAFLGAKNMRRTAAAFSPDSKRIVTGSNDGNVETWDARDGRPLAMGHSRSPVASAAFSPDGTRVVTAGRDGTVRIWNAREGERLVEAIGWAERHNRPVNSAAFSPDGGLVVTAAEDGNARVWDAHDGAHVVDLEGHTGSVKLAAFSPDGRRIVTASFDGTALLWSREGHLIATFDDHGVRVNGVAFSPDGRRLVTVGSNGNARVWDALEGKPIATFVGDREVNGAAFSPDGARVVVVSSDGRARVYPASVESFLGIACAVLRNQPVYDQVQAVCAPYLERAP
jgi:WD40 repeat protein